MQSAPEIPPDLIRRARGGDAGAFRKLVDHLAGLTYNIAWRMTGQAADAEDMSQEVFFRLHRHFAKYDPALPFLPWFRRLTTNACLNWCRSHQSRRPAPLGEDDPAAPEARAATEPGDALRKAIETLPPEQRLVLARFYFEELGVAEIAAAMDVPSGTIKTWLFRARESLRARLTTQVENLFGS